MTKMQTTKNQIEAALTAAQKKQLVRDMQEYLKEELRYEARPIVLKVAKKWLKDNEDWVSQAIESRIQKEMKQLLNHMRIDF